MRRGPLITALGVTALVLMTTACSSGVAEPTGDGGETDTPDSMTFVAYGGVTQDVMRDQWLDPWGETQGVTVVQDSPTDYAKLVSMVESGNPTWDLVDTEPFFPIQECGTVVQELDLSNIDENKLPAGTVSECAVPLWGYSLLLVYNPEVYGDNPPTSFADFFDLEAFPGTRLAPANAPSGPLEIALLADGVDPDELYPLDIDRALAKWDDLRGKTAFWSTASESQQALESGSADMALVWSGRAAEATVNGASIEPVWNQNLFGWASLSIPIGTKATTLAMSAIEDLLTPETQERLSENIAYAPVNSDAKPDLKPEYAKYNVTAPEIVAEQVVQNAEWWADNQAQAVEAWSNWTLG